MSPWGIVETPWVVANDTTALRKLEIKSMGFGARYQGLINLWKLLFSTIRAVADMSFDFLGTGKSIHQGHQPEKDEIETVKDHCESDFEVQSTT